MTLVHAEVAANIKNAAENNSPMKKHSFKRLMYTISSAILLVLAFPRFNLWFFAWIGLVPLFFALETNSIKNRFVIGYIFGIIFFTGILYWLFSVTIPGAIALILISALTPAIFCSICHTQPTHSKTGALAYNTLFIPAAWVLSEYFRTYFLTGFPWALLGYSQSVNLPIIQIADVTGVYGVSFLIVLANFGIYLVLRKAPQRFYSLFAIFIVFALVLAYGQKRINYPDLAQKLKVAVIQGNIPQRFKWDPQYRRFIMDKYEMLTKAALTQSPRLVVWPETSIPGYLKEENDLKSKVVDLVKSGNTNILAGSIRSEGSKVFNSAIFVSQDGLITESYDKIHLVPLGEFIPFKDFFNRFRAFIDKPIGDFARGSKFTVFKFKLHDTIKTPGNIQRITQFHEFSALICFEDIFPDLCRRFVKNGARFLVNITNDAWFGKTAAPYQHMQGSVFRAVENRVTVLRAANTGVSCIIDHTGKVLETVNLNGDDVFVDGYAAANITPNFFIKTFYTRHGDVFSWVSIFLVFIGIVFFRKRKT